MYIYRINGRNSRLGAFARALKTSVCRLTTLSDAASFDLLSRVSRLTVQPPLNRGCLRGLLQPQIHVPEFNYIEAFYYVYITKSFTKAAALMRRSQQAISEQISNLEQCWHSPLFIRKPVVMSTLFADELFKEIGPFVERMIALQRKNDLMPGEPLGLGASEFMFEHYLLPILSILKSLPKLSLMMKSGPREDCEAALEAGKVQLMIAALDRPTPGFQWEPLLSLPVVLLVPADHPAKSADAILSQQPFKERFITPPPCEGVARLFEEYRQARGIRLPQSATACSTSVVPTMVATGHGIGLCVGASLLTDRAGIRALPIEGVEPIVVGAQSKGKMSPTIMEFLPLLRDGAAKLRKSIDQTRGVAPRAASV
jgi:LysR family transcriptional regulator, hca operon transcriptional activator